MKLPTRKDYDKATPRQKGFMSYTFSQWPDSQIPEACPYEEGTPEWQKFQNGVRVAVLAAQDSEE